MNTKQKPDALRRESAAELTDDQLAEVVGGARNGFDEATDGAALDEVIEQIKLSHPEIPVELLYEYVRIKEGDEYKTELERLEWIGQFLDTLA